MSYIPPKTFFEKALNYYNKNYPAVVARLKAIDYRDALLTGGTILVVTGVTVASVAAITATHGLAGLVVTPFVHLPSGVLAGASASAGHTAQVLSAVATATVVVGLLALLTNQILKKQEANPDSVEMKSLYGEDSGVSKKSISDQALDRSTRDIEMKTLTREQAPE